MIVYSGNENIYNAFYSKWQTLKIIKYMRGNGLGKVLKISLRRKVRKTKKLQIYRIYCMYNIIFTPEK